jgi:hypothetical protein
MVIHSLSCPLSPSKPSFLRVRTFNFCMRVVWSAVQIPSKGRSCELPLLVERVRYCVDDKYIEETGARLSPCLTPLLWRETVQASLQL